MTGLNHVLTGAAIALAVRDPILTVPLAVASHFILDVIPHFDHPNYQYGSKYFAPIMVADGLISTAAILTIMWLAPYTAAVVALGSVCAIAPDFTWLYYYTRGRPQWPFFRFHSKIQWYERPPGALVEASYLIFICITIAALLKGGSWI